MDIKDVELPKKSIGIGLYSIKAVPINQINCKKDWTQSSFNIEINGEDLSI